MNALINYLIEANLGLCFFLLLYWILLQKETDFALKRACLLISIAISLIFPLLHISTEARLVPAIGGLIPTAWLPEIVVQGNETPAVNETHINFDAWLLTQAVYSAGLVITFVIFAARLLMLFKLIRTAPSYQINNLTILESPRNEHSSFSFFNFIFIGKSSELSEREKSLIIEHERVHAQRLHSIDVLLTNFLGIVFWFNPVLRIYKKIFLHLHEYEADARTVKYYDVNDYCSLLAKVALLSADIRLANHFSNSLTLKRIEMIRKIRSNIKWWKIALIGGTIPLFFFVVSCQDQLVDDITEIARNSNIAIDAPQAIVDRFEAVKHANPNSNYVLLEFNEEAEKLLAEMEKAHGIPASIELFTPDNGFYKNSTMNTQPEKISFNQSQEWEAAAGLRTFAIIEYNEMARKIAERSKLEGDIYTLVDEAAHPLNGLGEFYEVITKAISYPAEARKNGIVGKVFVEFVVQTDGSLSDIRILKGIGGGCDEEALRVVNASTAKWVAGKIQGVAVKERIVLPINFKLDGPEIETRDETKEPENSMNEVVVAGYNHN